MNAVSAWLYGCSALNATVLGFGERTGNPPLEAAVIEYIGLKGTDDGMDTRVITEMAEYFRTEIQAPIPANYPFVGSEFNVTRAGIHADGILKNPEIYNIFDTEKILQRPLRVMVTDKSGHGRHRPVDQREHPRHRRTALRAGRQAPPGGASHHHVGRRAVRAGPDHQHLPRGAGRAGQALPPLPVHLRLPERTGGGHREGAAHRGEDIRI